jgi:hypothetical protein
MAITSSQNNGQGVSRHASGSYLTDATAAAITITCGFKPRYVYVMNSTSLDSYEWFEGMADAAAVKRVTAGTSSAITTLGITPSDSGFIIGLDTDVNVTNEQIRWIALG